MYQYIIKYNPLSMRCQLLERNYFKIFKNILEKGRVARRLEDGNGENEASGMTLRRAGVRRAARKNLTQSTRSSQSFINSLRSLRSLRHKRLTSDQDSFPGSGQCPHAGTVFGSLVACVIPN